MKSTSSSDPRASDPLEDPRELVSRAMDGDGGPAALEHLCDRWADEGTVREAWHVYHLIGDAIRSDELGGASADDAAFVSRLRQRVAAEPRIVAPTPVAGRRTRAPRWLAPAAAVAGFALVAGVAVVVRTTDDEAAGPLVARTAPPPDGLRRAAVGAPAQAADSASAAWVTDAVLIRDARIDRYFEAHRGMRTSPAAASPGGALRSVDTLVPPPR